MLKLLVVQSGQTIPLTGSEIVVGRDAGNTLSFPGDQGISRRHARIFPDGNGYRIEDLGSTNGTFVGGHRISGSMMVFEGTEVRIGAQVFQFVADAPPPGRKVETSRGEKPSLGSSKKGEVEALYSQRSGDPLPNLDGCAMPSFDLSGCAKILMYLLIAFVIALLVAFIVMLISMALGALGIIGTVGQSGSGKSGGSSPRNDAGKQAPPPQQQQSQRVQNGIEILDVRIGFDQRGGSRLKPVVLVKWRNATSDPVRRLDGIVRVYDDRGRLLLERHREIVYSGEPVAPGDTHEDRLASEGVVVESQLSRTPATAKVEIDRVE